MEKLTARQIQKIMSRKETIPITLQEFRKKFCGQLIGKGSTRYVYALKQDPEHYVVKIERRRSDAFANITEWQMWNHARENGSPEGKDALEILAPCHLLFMKGSISILIQDRAVITPYGKGYPRLIPFFLTDHKWENYGHIDGKFKCFDYASALSLILDYGMIGYYVPPSGKRRVKNWRKNGRD